MEISTVSGGYKKLSVHGIDCFENIVENFCERGKYPVLFQVFHIDSIRQNDEPECCADLPTAFVSCIMENMQKQQGGGITDGF